MSHKDNQDLRVRDGGGWGWDEHELYTVFTPLIGPLGVAVYKAMTRLVPLVVVDPWRYRVSLRQIAEWSGMSKSSVEKQLKIILKLGMIIETRYLSQPPSYKLVSLRDLAKLGEAALKDRIGVHHMDTAPFDQRGKHLAEAARKAQKRKQTPLNDDELPFESNLSEETPSVHHVDTTIAVTEERNSVLLGVHHMDTVSTSEAMSSTSEAMSSTAYGHPYREEKISKSIHPLPPAAQGEVEHDDPDSATPGLPTHGCVYGDPDFPRCVPAAAAWVMAELAIGNRRIAESAAEQLELWCKRNRGQTLEAAAMRMAKQGRMLHQHAELLRHRPWGWRRFIGEGHWARPLPYSTPQRDATVGMREPTNPVRGELDEAAVTAAREALEFAAEKLAGNASTAHFADELRQFSARAEEHETLHDELAAIQPRMVTAFLAGLPSGERKALQTEADGELKKAIKRYPALPPSSFETVKTNWFRRVLRDRYGLPDLQNILPTNA